MARERDRVKERQWLQILREKQASGESVAVFCDKRRIPVHQYYWWQRELSVRNVEPLPDRSSRPAAFVAVRVPLASPTIEVTHPSGSIVRVVGSVDVQALRNVFEALDRKEA